MESVRLCTFVLLLSLAISLVDSQTSFTATYIKSNPAFFGFGLINGAITYDPTSITKSMLLTDTLNAGTVTNYYTYNSANTGVLKYEPNCVGYANSCEITDISSMSFWVLWYNTTYYGAAIAGDTTFPGCTRYNRRQTFTPSTLNYVDSLWLKSDGSVCGWDLVNGERYNITSTPSPATPSMPTPCVTPQGPTCMKPMNLVFIVDHNGPAATLSEVNQLKTELQTLGNSLAISPQIINTAVIGISGNSLIISDPTIVTSPAQFLGQISSSFKCSGATTCNPAVTDAVPAAINAAGRLIQNSATPYRPSTSTAFVFITWGGFSSSAAQINAAIQNASVVAGSKTITGSSLPPSSVVNFISIVVGNSAGATAATSTLNTVATNNVNTQINNVRLNPFSNIKTYPAGTDSIYNRVLPVSSVDRIGSQLSAPLAAGLCATNGLVSQSRSCAGCCGDCRCGVLCVQPDTCPQKNCSRQELTKAAGAPDSSLCCTLLPQCPGLTGTACNVSFCDSSTGSCKFITPPCPAVANFPTNCYDRVCDAAQTTSSVTVCRSVPKFIATINACFQRVCNEATNTITIVPLVNCPREPCSTIVCNNITGTCQKTTLPIPTPTAADACKTAVCDPRTNNSYIWVFPNTSSCTTTNRCQNVVCVGATCAFTPKCTADTCTNFTCDAAVGTCNPINCPTFGTFPNGTIDRCLQAPACTRATGPALSGCTLARVNCPNTDPCITASCVNGQCQYPRVCPLFETIGGVANQCRLLNTSSCVTGPCAYFNKTCADPAQLGRDVGCVVPTCTPSNGQCSYPIPCPLVPSNRCQLRVNSTCRTTCNYTTTVFCPSRGDICENNTCNPANGCTPAYPPLCPLTPNNQPCQLRVNSSCTLVRNGQQAACNYTPRVCTTADPCSPFTCNSGGTCALNNSLQCARFRVVNSSSVCQSVNEATCGGGTATCSYSVSRNCATGISWIIGTCRWSGNTTICTNDTRCFDKPCELVSGFVNGVCQYTPLDCSTVPSPLDPCTRYSCNPANNTCTSVVSNCPNSTNRCNFTTSCTLPCVYRQPACLSDPKTTPCHTILCDAATGLCSQRNDCPKTPCSNNTCLSNGTCSRVPFTCANTDPCNRTVCDTATDRCVSSVTCPPFQLVGGVTQFCSNRTSCSPCSYTLFTGCTNRTLCETARCTNATGACTYTDVSVTNNLCPLTNSTGCFARDNTTCSPSGRCSYNSLLDCTTPAGYPPCISVVCSNGRCVNSTNRNYPCPPPADSCRNATFDERSPTCCSEIPRCPLFQNNNRCNPVECRAGQCVVNSVTCPQNLSAIGAACQVAATGGACDSATGNCSRYVPFRCLAQDKCTDLRCDNSTGRCTIPVPNPNCSAACVALNCPTIVNCEYNDCIVDPQTGIARCELRNISSPAAPRFCVARDFCSTTQCIGGTVCISTSKTAANCEAEAITNRVSLPPCSRWSANPNDPQCCSPLPNCNTGVDPNFQCMLTSCAPDNVTCVLVDNTDTVCPPFNFSGNKCYPRKSCDNRTGSCDYFDLVTECAVNQTKVDPCFDGKCDPDTGKCYTVPSLRCVLGSKCINVVCPADRCVTQQCDPADGLCKVVTNNTCPPLDNCTDQVCLPDTGCNKIDFDPARCNVTDPCVELVLNKTVAGCCTTVPKCPPSTDPICNISACTASGQCFYSNKTCEQNEVSVDGVVNFCRVFTDCVGDCRYADVVCNATYPGVPCFRDECQPSTGKCITIDTCPKDKCVEQTCNANTSQCEVTFTRVCENNNCTTQVCDRITGCTTTSLISTSSCPTGPCTTPFLNPNKVGCCNNFSTCVSNDPCVLVQCNATDNSCIKTPACPSTKCADRQCIVVNGTPTCTPLVPKPCEPANNCSIAEVCVEGDGNPFVCVTRPRCAGGAIAGDICLEEVCIENATGAFCVARRNPALTCDDSDPCTSNDCLNGTCVNTFCPTDDACNPGNCTNGTCVYGPFQCDDNDACTNDTCVVVDGKATCRHDAVVCSQLDFCKVSQCLPTQGCVQVNRECLLNESCIFTGPNGKSELIPICYESVCKGANDSPYIDCETKQQRKVDNGNNGVTAINQKNCDVYQCYNQSCVYTYRQCPNTLAVVAVTAGVSALVIVGIILGIVAFIGCSGGAIYAVAAGSDKDDKASVMNNPLFKGEQKAFENPLNRTGHNDL